jgi:putative transposase
MPRTARASQGNWVYHVLNRGNARMEVFHKDQDYAAFIALLEGIKGDILLFCGIDCC